MNEQPTEFDSYARTYSERVNQALAFSGFKLDYFTKVKTNYVLDIVGKAFSREADLLDVGCGIGNCHAALRPFVHTLTGVDVSAASIEVARASHANVRYEAYDGLSLPFNDQDFDAAVAICVFHHVPSAGRIALAREILRVLRPGGLFAIFEHNPRNPITMRVVSKCEFDQDAVLLASSEAEYLLRDAGFDDVTSQHILSIPTWNKFSRRVDLALGALRLGAQYFTVGLVADP